VGRGLRRYPATEDAMKDKPEPDCLNCPAPCGKVERVCPDGVEGHDPKVAAQRTALDAIIKEREYQRQRWGPDHDEEHTPGEWYLILSVWMGKLANETPMFQGVANYDEAKFLKRLAQVGAIAAAAYEAISASPG
jgi:hypothetical protein